MANTVTPEQFQALKARLNGKLTPEEARTTLIELGEAGDTPPILKLHTASALLDLRMGRSVQSTMARLRRAVGLDKPKPSSRP